MKVPNNASADGRTPGWEVIRGQTAGLVAGATVGAAMGAAFSHALLGALYGVLVGSFLGVLAGFVVGMALRFTRRAPLILAASAAGITATTMVAVALFALGWTSQSNAAAFPIVSGVVAGIAAAVATPWIRRTPLKPIDSAGTRSQL